jgi:hypothetical protein
MLKHRVRDGNKVTNFEKKTYALTYVEENGGVYKAERVFQFRNEFSASNFKEEEIQHNDGLIY